MIQEFIKYNLTGATRRQSYKGGHPNPDSYKNMILSRRHGQVCLNKPNLPKCKSLDWGAHLSTFLENQKMYIYSFETAFS